MLSLRPQQLERTEIADVNLTVPIEVTTTN